MPKPSTILLALLAGGGAAYAYTRIRRKGGAGGGTGTASGCQALEAISPEAVRGCQAAGVAIGVASAIKDKFSSETSAEVDAHNIALNGPIVERAAMAPHPGFWDSGLGHIEALGDGQTKVVGALKGRNVPRHANGCVPVFGNSDHCVVGTKSYARNPQAFSGEPFVNKPGYWSEHGASLKPADGMFNYSVEFKGDPLTQVHKAGTTRFPLDCGAGKQQWWIAGQPKCCPPGWSPVRRAKGDGTWEVDCQVINTVRPMGVLVNLTPISEPGTKPGARTQGGAVVTESKNKRNNR